MGKLVRDKIPDIIKSEGKEGKHHIMDDEEYLSSLFEKLKEETQELIESNGDIKELADVSEVMDALRVAQKIRVHELDIVKEKKVEDNGAFKEKIFLESIDGENIAQRNRF